MKRRVLNRFKYFQDLTRKQKLFFIMRIFFAIAISFFIFQFRVDFLEAIAYDLRVKHRPSPKSTESVVIIPIVSSTVEYFKRVPDATDHFYFLEKLGRAQPRRIAYFTHLDQIEGSEEENFFLANKIKNLPFVFVSEKVNLKGQADRLALPPPFERVPVLSAMMTQDLESFARDRVTRRMLVSYQDSFSFSLQMAQLYNSEIKTTNDIRGKWKYLDSEQVYIDYRPSGSFTRIPFEKIYSNDFDKDFIKDKIVIIGNDLGQNITNYFATPFSKEVTGYFNVLEVQANMLETLIRNSAPILVPEWIDLLLTIIVSLLTVYVVLRLKPLTGIAALVIVFFSFSFFFYITFWPFGFWFRVGHPFIAVFLCYYFFIPYRLIMENRKTWEYYEKNRLLLQVEELKSNFISMMSHDLKTPLARIEGMVDVVLSNQERLHSDQKSAMELIKKSAQDLRQFITSILSLGRIESENIKLNLQVKDINSVLEEAVGQCEYKSSLKNITLRLELEPLFSIKVDPDLIRQVFLNLIENAIKYSPDYSSVLITSDEDDRKKIIVQIADQGMGILKEDQENIFMKFFRSKDVKSSPIKGSGLGLYLAKYFVELHQGRIFVESEVGQGSTFTVELPIV